MRLTLTYQGRLPATQRGVSSFKAEIRRQLHPQIRDQIAHMLDGPNAQYVTSSVDGFEFVSPAHKRFRTAIDLDLIILTPSKRRHAGDLDNRLKTLIDGMTRPVSLNQMQGFTQPDGGGPTYCLLDDDGLVRSLRIDSRTWHAPTQAADESFVLATASIVLGTNADMSAPTGTMFVVL